MPRRGLSAGALLLAWALATPVAALEPKFKDGELTLTSRAPEQGEARIRMDVEYEGEPIGIGFNPYFLVDALKVMEDEEVMFELKEPTRPGVLKGNGDFLYLVMPVSLA